MARIAGINIPPNQHAEIGLDCHLWHRPFAQPREILGSGAASPKRRRFRTLPDAELERIRDAVSASSPLKAIFVVKFNSRSSA